jgi:hypothetical protein
LNGGVQSWYPYYAGYSSEFVQAIIAESQLDSNSKILDPWNGCGITTYVGLKLGYDVYGYDINPVMVLVAKAYTVKKEEAKCLKEYAELIVAKAEGIENVDGFDEEPLELWMTPKGALSFRKIEFAVNAMFVSGGKYRKLIGNNVDNVTSVASFFYLCLFRVLDEILHRFRSSNPTWIKKPLTQRNRLAPSWDKVKKSFVETADILVRMAECDDLLDADNRNQCHLIKASSTHLPSDSNYFDLVITSPPYCTRIDYAISTMPQLMLLGYHHDSTFIDLRREFIGTSMVNHERKNIDVRWGETCLKFLESVSLHSSKASSSYYYFTHVNYYDSLFRSIQELGRVLKVGGKCVIVLQDSYYKDVYNDVPRIVEEMCLVFGMFLIQKNSFPSKFNMARINPSVKKYRSLAEASESVLIFEKKK